MWHEKNNRALSDPETESKHKSYKPGHFYDGNFALKPEEHFQEGSFGLGPDQGEHRASIIPKPLEKGAIGQHHARLKGMHGIGSHPGSHAHLGKPHKKNFQTDRF